jgi:hypothetical protein
MNMNTAEEYLKHLWSPFFLPRSAALCEETGVHEHRDSDCCPLRNRRNRDCSYRIPHLSGKPVLYE